MLKVRFRYLDQSGGALQYSPQRVSHIIVTCCTFYNLALQWGDELAEEETDGLEVFSDEENADGDEAEEVLGGDDDGDETFALAKRGRCTQKALIAARFVEDDDYMQRGDTIDPHIASMNI